MIYTTEGPQAQGSVRSVETEPRCVNGLYHGACGHDNVQQQHSLSVATTTFILQQTAKQYFLEVV